MGVFVSDIKKILISTIFGGLLTAGGMLYYSTPNEIVCPTIKPKEQVVQSQERRTITEKPDGSKVTEIITDKIQTKVEPIKTDRIIVKRPRYSLDVIYLPSLDRQEWRDIELLVGMRLADSPLSATLGYNIKYNQLSLGVRYEW